MVFCALAALLITLARPAGACPADYFDGLKGTRVDVLVVVNENSPDSCEVGRYYAERRGIAPAAIARVYAPTDFFIDWQAYAVLREQLLAHLLRMARAEPPACAEDGKGRTPRYCDASLEQIRTGSGVNYLVTTLGVPSRVRMDYPGGDFLDFRGRNPIWMPTSVDNLLRFQLLNYHDYATQKLNGVFGSSGRYGQESRWAGFAPDGRGMRPINALLDRELVVGRIDGLTAGAAKRLLDRALAAEREGVVGRYLVDAEATAAPGNVWGTPAESWARLMLAVFGESSASCMAAGSQAIARCRAALLHGDWLAAPKGPERVLLQGDIYGSQASAGHFANLLKYRRVAGACGKGQAPLCRALQGEAAEACRAASEDVFREIDTRCVGVAPGFVGTQQVSFPLAYLAAKPTAWGWGEGMWRGDEQRMDRDGEGFGLALPALRSDDGHGDNVSLWGGPQAQADARCFESPQSLAAAPGGCPARPQRLSLAQLAALPSPRQLPAQGAQRFSLSFWVKHTGAAPLSGEVKLLLLAAADEKVNGAVALREFRPDEGYVQLVPGAGWQRVERSFTVSRGASPGWDGRYVRLGLSISVPGLLAPLGVDDVQLLDERGVSVLQNGQFDQGHEQTDTGDYAVGFLNRLNGTAFFGSVSHYQSGGRSFFSNAMAALGGTDHFQTAMRYFMRGLPLGDAVWLGELNVSGVLYGDPLFSPLAVRIEPVLNGGMAALDLRGEVRNGEQGVTAWQVEYCAGADPWACMRDGRWKATGLAGKGRVASGGALGRWTPPGPGLYSLRLRAECEVGGYRQTFSDFTSLRYGGY